MKPCSSHVRLCFLKNGCLLFHLHASDVFYQSVKLVFRGTTVKGPLSEFYNTLHRAHLNVIHVFAKKLRGIFSPSKRRLGIIMNDSNEQKQRLQYGLPVTMSIIGKTQEPLQVHTCLVENLSLPPVRVRTVVKYVNERSGDCATISSTKPHCCSGRSFLKMYLSNIAKYDASSGK